MSKKYRLAVLLLAVLLTFFTGGCKKADLLDENQTEDILPVPDSEGQKEDTEVTAEKADGQEETKIEIDTDPQFDGVYKNEDASVVIRYADEEMCDFIISAGENGADGYLSGIAQISDNVVVYETEIYGLTMTVNFDELSIEETGNNTYSAAGFAGTYTRTDDDPYAVEVRQSAGSNAIPDTVGSTVINGADAVLYVDPENRFTATVPDVFSGAPEDAQPESGIHLTSVDGDVDAVIEAVNGGAASAEELKAELETEYGVEADLFVDGTVALEFLRSGDDNFIIVIYAHVIDGGVAKVEYMFDAAQESYFRPLLDQVSININ